MCALVSCLVHLQIISIFLVQDVLAFRVILSTITKVGQMPDLEICGGSSTSGKVNYGGSWR